MRISDWSSDVCSSDLDGRDQRAVGADECACAYFRAVFQEAVIVAGDGPRADVGVGPDAGVADIAQVIGLCARAERCGLHLHEIADARLLADHRARPQAGIRDRKSTRLNSSHYCSSLMASSV